MPERYALQAAVIVTAVRKGALYSLLVSAHYQRAEGPITRNLQARQGRRMTGPISRDMPYQNDRSRAWLKIRNPESPTMLRVSEER